MSTKSGSFLKGTLIGVALGAIAGVLFAPKSGKETREDIKKAAVNVKNKAEDLYTEGQKRLDKKIEALKKAGTKINEKVYLALVKEVVDELKNDGKVASAAGKKAGDQLKSDWSKVKKALEA